MIKKLSFFTFLMLLIPIIAWATNWQWSMAQMNGNLTFNIFTVLFTDTASAPYALITCVIFMFWIMWLTRSRYSWFLVGFICAGSVVGTQTIKEGAKSIFKEPRPFVVQIERQGYILPAMGYTDNNFYLLSKEQQAVAAKKAANVEDELVIAEHQSGELGYSFPSGHTIFAASWLLVFAGFLFGLTGQAVIFTQIFAILWAGGILTSRLYLGMHFPIDLFASTLIAWAFHIIVFVWVIPYLEQYPLFKKRG